MTPLVFYLEYTVVIFCVGLFFGFVIGASL